MAATDHTGSTGSFRLEMSRLWLSQFLPPVVVGVAAIAGWQVAHWAHWLPDSMPAPWAIATLLGDVLTTSSAWSTMAETMRSWAIGFAVTLLIGITIGAMAGLNPVGKRLVSGLVEFCRPIPSVIFIPVIVVAFGTSRRGVVLLIVLSAVWPVLLQTMGGVRDADPLLADVSHAYGMSRTQWIRHCVAPAALAFVVTGVRIAATIALVVTVTVEMLGTGRGIGSELAKGLQSGDYARLYGWALIAAVIGLAVDSVLGQIERRVLHWHPSIRSERAA